MTFYDYQKAFYSYWDKYNVVKGYYFENGVKKKARGWKQFKRWEYGMANQMDPATGRLPQKTANQVYAEFYAGKSLEKSGDLSNWTLLGTNSSDGGYAGIGRVNCVGFHPSDLSTYWVGSAGGGLWSTSDDGANWSCLTDQIGMLLITDIAVPTDYASSNTIYIATGDRDVDWESYSIGVLKSTDGGISWNPTGLTYAMASNVVITKLLMDPNDNNTLLAATSLGVLKTTDGGQTWNNQLTSHSFVDLEAKPTDFNTLYGSTRNGEVYKSIDGGLNWAVIFTGVSTNRLEMAVSPNQPSWLYFVLAKSDNGLYGVYQSTDEGANFTQVADGTVNMMGYEADGSDTGGQAWYTLTMAASPLDANTVVIGGVNTWKSIDGGVHWNIVNHWTGNGLAPAVHADKHMHTYRSDGHLFEGNDGGFYHSPDGGTTWNDRTNGMVISQMYRLGVAQTATTEVITGLQDNGTKLLSGGTWSDVKGGDGMECIIDFTSTDIQFGTYVNGQISKTTDHWVSANDVQPNAAGDGAWVTPYVMDPNDHNVMYAGYADLWMSIDNGDNWQKMSNVNSSQRLKSIAVAPSNSQVLYMADDTHMWRSLDGGQTWSNIGNGLPVSNSNITYIAVKKDDPHTLWVTMSGYNTQRVYKSVNSGVSWGNISTGLPSLPAYSIVQNYQADSLQFFVATELGVYKKDGSANWVPYLTGLPHVKVYELEIYYNPLITNSKLRAATYGRGLWETPLFPTDVSIGGIASVNDTCIVSNHSATLTLINYAGSIQWQQSSDGVTNWISAVGGTGSTTTTYVTPSLTNTIHYRAKVTQGVNPPDYSNVITLKIKPVLTLTPFPTMCATDSALFLNQVSPSGGTYSGNHVSNGYFQPSTSSYGSNQVTYNYTDTNQCSASIYGYIVVHDCTSNAPKLGDDDYAVSPNPTKDILKVDYGKNFESLNIIDYAGKLVYTKQLSSTSSTQNISMLQYAAGEYFIQLISASKKVEVKVVVLK